MGYTWKENNKRRCPHCRKTIHYVTYHGTGGGGDEIREVEKFTKKKATLE